ncbi:hypothetical protein WJX74_000235 [Apatococcus lobatus]|uniref:Uncharacterized protein n=1 Tax=Apatococcus lobatus TaxID=904363 RepID=A0AAW1QHT0_9CHLO
MWNRAIQTQASSLVEGASSSAGALLGLFVGLWWATLHLLWLCTSRKGINQLLFGEQPAKPLHRSLEPGRGSKSSTGISQAPQKPSKAVQYASTTLSSIASSAVQASAQAAKTTAATFQSAKASPTGQQATQAVCSAEQYAQETLQSAKATPVGAKATLAAASASQIAQDVYDKARATAVGQKASQVMSHATQYAQQVYDRALATPAGQQASQAASQVSQQAQAAYNQADATSAQVKGSQAANEAGHAAQSTHPIADQEAAEPAAQARSYAQYKYDNAKASPAVQQAAHIAGQAADHAQDTFNNTKASLAGQEVSGAAEQSILHARDTYNSIKASPARQEASQAAGQASGYGQATYNTVKSTVPAQAVPQAAGEKAQATQDAIDYLKASPATHNGFSRVALHEGHRAQGTYDKLASGKTSQGTASNSSPLQKFSQNVNAKPASSQSSSPGSQAVGLAKEAVNQVGNSISQAVDHPQEYAQQTYDTAATNVKQAVTQPRQYAQETLDSIQATPAGAQASQAMAQAGQYALDTYEEAKATPAAQKASQAASQAGASAQHTYENAKATPAGARATELGSQALETAAKTIQPVIESPHGAYNQAVNAVRGESSRAPQIETRASNLPWNAPAPQINRTNEMHTASSPTYNFQPNSTTRRGRIDSPVAEQRPSHQFFDNTALNAQQPSFTPILPAPTSARSGPATTPSIAHGSDASSFNTTHPAETFSSGYTPPLQAGMVDVQPASGISGMAGLIAATSGAVQVASGQPGPQPLAGGAVIGASAAHPPAGDAPGSTLLVAPEGQGPSVKAGRLSHDAPSFGPPSIRTAPQGEGLVPGNSISSFPVSGGYGSEYTTPSSSPIGAQHGTFSDTGSSSQGNPASNDEEDHISQATVPSYSSMAPLGLPAGDQGLNPDAPAKKRSSFSKAMKTGFNKLTGKAGKQEREDAGSDSLDHSKGRARRGSDAHGGHAHRTSHK